MYKFFKFIEIFFSITSFMVFVIKDLIGVAFKKVIIKDIITLYKITKNYVLEKEYKNNSELFWKKYKKLLVLNLKKFFLKSFKGLKKKWKVL